MDPLQPTLTKAGLAAIVADSGPAIGPVAITQIGLTDTAFTPSSTLTALPGEFTRLAVSGEASGDDTIHIVALDASDDTYGYRGFGVYLEDGTLFAVYGQAERIAEKAQVSATYLALDVQLEQGQTSAITFGDTNFLNPPATTARQGVVELATPAEAAAGTDTTRALTPAGAKAALMAWLLAQDGAGSGLDADLFDGRDSAYYTDIIARLGYTPVDEAALTPAVILALLLRVDGADSGLDADRLDGHHGADFALLADPARCGSNANGYWELRPNGMIEQWGEVNAGETGSPPSLPFPIPFTDLASVNLQVTARTPNTGASSGNKVGGNKVSLSQFNVFSDDLEMAVFWRAIGR